MTSICWCKLRDEEAKIQLSKLGMEEKVVQRLWEQLRQREGTGQEANKEQN